MIIINKKINDLLDDFIDNKGFHLESFQSYTEDLDFYLYKEIKNGYLVIIFSKENEIFSQVQTFKDHAFKNNINFYLINIILSDINREFSDFNMDNYSEIIVFESGEVLFEDEISKRLLSEKDSLDVKKKSLKEKSKEIPLTMSIIIINIIMYIFTAIISRSFSIDTEILIAYGAKVNELISNGQIYRFITAAFLHGNLIHLFFNMYALFNIGGLIEKVLGKKSFITIYIFSAFTSSFLSYISNPYVSVGASGGIFGLLGSLLVLSISGNEQINKELLYNILTIIGINLLIGFMGRNIIDNFGHLGGLLGGLISTWIIILFNRRKNKK